MLVHGLGVSSRYFLRLAGDRTVYAPDIPGFGRSQTPLRPLDVHGQAELLAACPLRPLSAAEIVELAGESVRSGLSVSV